MEFIAGTILMVAAIVLLGFAKYAITRWENSSWISEFAGTETMALLITTTCAFGIAFLCAGLASAQSGLGYTEFAASIGVIVLAAIGVVRVFRRAPRKGPKAVAPTSSQTTV
jgi:hypothetical protein